MSRTITDIGQFYRQIDDFKNKMELIMNHYGQQQEIVNLNKYYDKLLEVKKVNIRLAIDLLYKHGVTPYAEHIIKRDENFFLQEVSALTQDGQYKESVSSRDFLFIGQIRQLWADFNQSTKKSIWDYVQVICMLAEKIVGGNVLTTTREYLRSGGLLS